MCFLSASLDGECMILKMNISRLHLRLTESEILDIESAICILESNPHGTLLNGYVPAWIGGGFGGEWIHVYVWLSPFTVHLKLSQHC